MRERAGQVVVSDQVDLVVDSHPKGNSIVQAARVSYGRGTKTPSEDAALINYLMRNRHTTPFEMCEIKLHVKLPIFVARQWIRHRTASVNEYSARYSILDREFYLPSYDAIAGQSVINKQGRTDVLSNHEAKKILDLLTEDAERSFESYYTMLNQDASGHIVDHDRVGLSRELARIGLPLSTYTQWYWKIDLHNLLHFLQLRSDVHAQYEFRLYAKRIMEIVKLWVPITYEAFLEHHLEGEYLSRSALAVVRKLLAGEAIEQENSHLSPRQWRELMQVLGRS
jgi:thymidylate synthase (FAD)